MDYREIVINEVELAVQDLVSEDVWTEIQDALVVVLNKYEVTERCTDIAVVDDKGERMLKTFAVIKSLEGLSDKTIDRYLRENRKLIEFLNMPLEDITTNDIRVYMASRRKNNVSNRTLDGMRRCYSTFFDWLHKEDVIPKNPCSGLKQIKYKKEVKKPFSAVELEKIKVACDNIRDTALVHFLYSTGCRVSEVSNLNITDVNYETHECLVLGKGNKERIVYISEVAMMYLKKYLSTRTSTSEALFEGKGTERLGGQGIRAILNRIEKQSGVPNVHPHRFRRTLTTNLINRGMSIQEVAEILGHADLKTTQVYYCINKENVKSSYKKFAA